ncbi:MAG TPA: chemotaxis protein CheW [Gemmatimonadales bacterium]|nr:chemotaxis protein CheW [Gemmatimonadales bacterium]
MSGGDILQFAEQLGPIDARPEAPPEPELHLVVFRLGGEEYAVPIGLVREVVRVADITRVPHAPAHVRGVMNLRGRILPVVEIRSRLGLEVAELTPSSRVVVVDLGRRTVGLLVDAVAHVTRLEERLVAAPPEEVRSAGGDAVTGVARLGDRLLVLLDLSRVLRADPSEPLPSATP